jgi:hypothetical protein
MKGEEFAQLLDAKHAEQIIPLLAIDVDTYWGRMQDAVSHSGNT